MPAVLLGKDEVENLLRYMRNELDDTSTPVQSPNAIYTNGDHSRRHGLDAQIGSRLALRKTSSSSDLRSGTTYTLSKACILLGTEIAANTRSPVPLTSSTHIINTARHREVDKTNPTVRG